MHSKNKQILKKKNESKGKKVVLLLVVLIAIIILSVFFIKKYYKTTNLGNTILNKTTEGITEYILNINSYDAQVEITVNSNKNTNKYIVRQQFASPNIAKQVVQEPSNIKDLTTMFDGTNLKIENTKLNLTILYENYNYITENHLFLNYFIADYQNSSESKVSEKDNTIIMQTKANSENTKNTVYKKLYVDKNSGKPIKMEVQDINQKTQVYILYNEIKINSTKKEEILASRSFPFLSNM